MPFLELQRAILATVGCPIPALIGSEAVQNLAGRVTYRIVKIYMRGHRARANTKDKAIKRTIEKPKSSHGYRGIGGVEKF
jgi:hypothetical protein